MANCPGCRVKQATLPTSHRTRSTTLVPLLKSRIIAFKTSWKVSNSHNHHDAKKKEEVDTIMMQKSKKEEVQVIQVRRAQIGKTGVISRGIN
jgi:hypothetical protein